MRNIRPLVLAPFLALAVALSACSSDSSSSDPADANGPTVASPAETPGAGASDPANSQSDRPDIDGLPQFSGVNRLILGEEVIELDPFIQCAVFSDSVSTIAGYGRGDMSITFAADVFSADRLDFAIQVSDGTMWVGSEGLRFVVEGETVTGGGELATHAGERKPATFQFDCS